MTRAVTPYEAREHLVAGEFHRDARYENWRPRGTPDWLLIYTVAGTGRIAGADGQEWRTAPGDAILYEPHAHQDYRTAPAVRAARKTAAWRLQWTHFHPRPHWLPWLQWPARARGLRSLRIEPGEVRRQMENALGEMVRLSSQQELPGHVDLAANALERALIWAHTLHGEGKAWARLDDRVRRAAELLGEELRQPVALATLAARCGLSVSRLAHLFKAQTGLSPQCFGERRRMERAGQLLRSTSLSVGEIAAEVGFESAFYFARRFRRHSGQSPTEFRQGGGR